MEEQRFDGSGELVSNPTAERFFASLLDSVVKVTAMHKPGSVVEHSDGKRYVVGENGAWRKLRPDEHAG